MTSAQQAKAAKTGFVFTCVAEITTVKAPARNSQLMQRTFVLLTLLTSPMEVGQFLLACEWLAG